MSRQQQTTYIRIKHRSFLFRLTNSLTNHQKYYTMIIIVLLGFGLLIYGLIREFNREIAVINAEQRSNVLQLPLKELHENVSKHFSLMRRLSSGDLSVKGDLVQRQALVGQDLRVVLSKQEDTANLFRESGKVLYDANGDPMQLQDLEKRWETLQRRAELVSLSEVEKTHRVFLDDLSYVIRQIEDAVNPGSFAPIVTYYLSQVVNYHIPRQQFGLSELHRKLLGGEGKLSTAELLVRVKADAVVVTDLVEKILEEVRQSGEDSLEPILKDAFSDYELRFSQLLFSLEKSVAGEEEFSSNALQVEVRRGLDATIALYSASENALQKILQIRRAEIVPWKYILLATSLLLTVFGVLLGKFFVARVIDSIESLDMGYKELAKGKLNTRIPMQFNDEIGRASIGFNRMADKFESLVAQQRDLLEATKKLSGGNFSTRVNVGDLADEKTKQLASSFNNMARSFEEIIKKVQLLGDSLKNSAKSISDTSKHFEDSTKQQEETTHTIYGTSLKISDNARTFADTISDVTQIVDKASTLASHGRESLNMMEAIMTQMVEASSDIAAKLGVLSEKAANINLVITTITIVADQTNLLSINAAIIADKAGEFGKSFSIIANEIRGLADQTAEATLDIEGIVDAMMSAVSASVMGVDDFIQEIREGVAQNKRVAEQLAQIIERVQALAPRFELVNDGMQTQCDASRQITDAINKLSKSAHITAESLHQFALTTSELNESASSLEQAVAVITKRSYAKTS